MKSSEVLHLALAIVVLAALIIAPALFNHSAPSLAEAFLFSFIILTVSITAKKFFASLLESDVEHQIWTLERWGLHKQDRFKKPLPIGILLSIMLSLFSFGTAKLMTLLVYETTPRKTRSVRGFGHTGVYTYTSMTDWHNALIGAAGIVAILLLAIIAYFLPLETYSLEPLARIATFYAFSNLLPLGKLDGTQIFFGSRVLYAALAIVTLVFFLYALLLV
jgi:hypothetical protein